MKAYIVSDIHLEFGTKKFDFSNCDLIVDQVEIIHFNQGGHPDTFPSDHWPVLMNFFL